MSSDYIQANAGEVSLLDDAEFEAADGAFRYGAGRADLASAEGTLMLNHFRPVVVHVDELNVTVCAYVTINDIAGIGGGPSEAGYRRGLSGVMPGTCHYKGLHPSLERGDDNATPKSRTSLETRSISGLLMLILSQSLYHTRGGYGKGMIDHVCGIQCLRRNILQPGYIAY